MHGTHAVPLLHRDLSMAALLELPFLTDCIYLCMHDLAVSARTSTHTRGDRGQPVFACDSIPVDMAMVPSGAAVWRRVSQMTLATRGREVGFPPSSLPVILSVYMRA